MGIVAFWTQPIATAIDFMRATFRTAIETGDLTFACYGMDRSLTSLLLRNDPLDAVWRESEQALDVCRKARFRDLRDMILNQQRFIATMQGRSATSSTFSAPSLRDSNSGERDSGRPQPRTCFPRTSTYARGAPDRSSPCP
jgi:hypothetical protein